MLVYSTRFSLAWSILVNVRTNLFHVLRRLSVEEQDIDNVGLLLTEYLTNLLRHANGEGASVGIEIIRSAGTITLLIKDQTSFNNSLERKYNESVEEGLASGAPQQLKEGGMGLDLILSLFPGSRYSCSDGVNQFELEISISNERKPHIVIVDDSASSILLLTNYLNEGYDVTSFSEPSKALRALVRNPPDIAIIDMMMPEMAGDELIDLLRTHEKLSQTKIIVNTGEPNSAAAKRANRLGIHALVQKPVTKAQLNQLVEMLLSNNLRDGQSTQSSTTAENFMLGNINCFPRGAVNAKQSGDMLFHFPSDSGDLLIFCDVMGHGASASVYRDRLFGLFNGMIVSGVSSATDIVKGFAQAMYPGNFTANSVVSLLCMKVTDRSIAWVSAGHPAPIILNSEKVIFNQEHVQPLTGLMEDYNYTENTIELDDFSRVLLVSDGVYENIDKRLSLATNIKYHLEGCSSCTNSLNSAKVHREDADLVNCLWANSLSLLSQASDDASIVLLS